MDVDVPTPPSIHQVESAKPVSSLQPRVTTPQYQCQSSSSRVITINPPVLATRSNITIPSPRVRIPTLTKSYMPSHQVRPQIIARQQPPTFILPQVCRPNLPRQPSPRMEQAQMLPKEPARFIGCPSPVKIQQTAQAIEIKAPVRSVVIPPQSSLRVTPGLPQNAVRRGQYFQCMFYKKNTISR